MYYMMSIHSKYATEILNGKKTVEIRRMHINIKEGDYVAIYATLPVARIVGYFVVKDTIYADTDSIWFQYHTSLCISPDIYKSYSEGKAKMSAILISSVKKVDGKSLSEIDIRIPQSYVHISEAFFKNICNLAEQ